MINGDPQELRSPLTNALHDWVSGALEREAIFDHFGNQGARPSRPFVTMRISSEPMGWPTRSVREKDPAPPKPEKDLIETVCQQFEVFVSMNIIGGDVFRDYAKLRLSVAHSEWQEMLAAGGLGFQRVTASRDLSAIVKDDFEQRSQADWFFYTTTESEGELSSIETMKFTNTGDNSSFTVGA